MVGKRAVAACALAMAWQSARVASAAAGAGSRAPVALVALASVAAPANLTDVHLVRVERLPPALAIASVACGAAAGAGLLALVVWMAAALLRRDRRPDRWRPRPPPRGSLNGRLLLLPSPAPSVADDGYITPRTVSQPASPTSPVVVADPNAHAPATNHTYLLVLADDAQVPQSTIPAEKYANGNISLVPWAGAIGDGEPGYLQMKGHPSVLKILQCEKVPLDLESLKDRLYSPTGERVQGVPVLPHPARQNADSGYQEMANLMEVQNTLGTFNGVSQTTLLKSSEHNFHNSQEVQHNEEASTNNCKSSLRIDKNNIQNRLLPPPPRPTRLPLKSGSSTANTKNISIVNSS